MATALTVAYFVRIVCDDIAHTFDLFETGILPTSESSSEDHEEYVFFDGTGVKWSITGAKVGGNWNYSYHVIAVPGDVSWESSGSSGSVGGDPSSVPVTMANFTSPECDVAVADGAFVLTPTHGCECILNTLRCAGKTLAGLCGHDLHTAAIILGTAGGRITGGIKADAARENGLLGGWNSWH